MTSKLKFDLIRPPYFGKHNFTEDHLFVQVLPADGLSVQALTRSCENKAAAKAKQMTNAPAQRRSIESHLSNLGAPSPHWAKKVMVAPFASEFQCQVEGHRKKIGAFGLNYPPLL